MPMAVLLLCPRCDIALEPKSVRETTLHVCGGCEGVWVDGDRVAGLYPALRHHAKRIDELLDAGARFGHGIVHCPRCKNESLEFPFFDLWLDLCEQCHGVWLDGDEVGFVGRVPGEERGLPPREIAKGYRDEQALVQQVSCRECGNEVHPRRTVLTGEGPVCDHCVEVERMAAELERTSGSRGLLAKVVRPFQLLLELLDHSGRKPHRRL